MRIVLHIGVWKTGSSAIQRALADNRRELRRHGVVSPAFPGPEIGHNGLLNALRAGQGDEVERMLATIRADCAGLAAPVVVLSSEHFWQVRQRPMRRLAETLRRLSDDIEVVAYVRPQEEMWRSLYAQQAKWLRVREGDPFWGGSAFVGRHIAENAMNFGKCLTRFRRVFGAATVRLYDREALAGGDIVTDFMQTIGAPAPPRPAPIANESLGWKGVGLALWAAARLDDLGVEGPARRAFQPCFADTIRDMAAGGDADWLGAAPNFLSHEERLRVRAHYARDTKRLSRRFFDGAPPFPPVRELSVSPFGAAEIPEAERDRAQALFLKRVERRRARRG